MWRNVLKGVGISVLCLFVLSGFIPELKLSSIRNSDSNSSYYNYNNSSGGSSSGGSSSGGSSSGGSSSSSSKKCMHSGCTRKRVTSGDSVYCSVHSNRCLECRCYIDEDATYCLDCLYSALW